MAAPNIFSKPHLRFVHQSYLKMMLQPAEITVALNKKFGTNFEKGQVQRAISSRGWSKRRKKIEEDLEGVETVSDRRIVSSLARKHEEVMAEMAEGALGGARRALQFAQTAENVRSLAAAGSAAKSFFSTFALASGIENKANRPTGHSYTFNFASTPVKRVGVATKIVSPVTVDGVAGVGEAAPVDVELNDKSSGPAGL
jgi:hypothetical protein